MVDFGFSLYPEAHDLEISKSYMDLLASQGAKRLFLSLLQIPVGDEAIFDNYRAVVAYANDLGIRVIADVSPAFIEQNGWSNQLLDKAHAFGLSGIRLDEALPLEEIVALTNNPYGLKIELNMSTDKFLLIDLLSNGANPAHIIACHNFYPHALTGLSNEHFLEMSTFYHEAGIETAAFVNAQTANEGPWPLDEGLCTVEDHRYLTIGTQVNWLKATGVIDHILIANQFISPRELAELTNHLQSEQMTLEVDVLPDLTPIEEAVLTYPHRYRGDVSAYLLRSTQPRVVYAAESIPQRSQLKQVSRGSVLIDNDAYGRYKGELQLALKDFMVSDKVNIVGQLTPESLLLLDYLKPWQDFRLKIVSRTVDFSTTTEKEIS